MPNVRIYFRQIINNLAYVVYVEDTNVASYDKIRQDKTTQQNEFIAIMWMCLCRSENFANQIGDGFTSTLKRNFWLLCNLSNYILLESFNFLYGYQCTSI